MNAGLLLSGLRDRIIGRSNTALPIGVDFGADRVNFVQCERDTQGLVIRAATSIYYPVARESLLQDPVALKRLVRNALRQSAFIGCKVSASLPASAVKVVPLTIQITEKQGEQAAVLRALREKLRPDLSQDIVDYVKVRSTNLSAQEQEVLVIVAQRVDVMKHLQLLHAAGLEAQALDIGSAALTRVMVALQSGDFNGAEVLLNFGLTKTYITALWGRRLMLDREMDFGLDFLTQRISKMLGVDASTATTLFNRYGFAASPNATDPNEREASQVLTEILHAEFATLAEELSRTLVYIASKTHGHTAQKIYLNGSIANVPGIAQKLEESISIPVEILNPLKRLRTLRPVDAILTGSSMALATGLALRDDSSD